MYSTTTKTQALNPSNRCENMGAIATRGGPVTPGMYLTQFGSTVPELAKWFRVGTTGDLVIENIDGTPIPYLNAIAGEKIIVSGRRILVSFDFGGTLGLVTTTAAQIVWYGGA